MDKFKDVVIKLSENAPPDLKILIQEHLTKFTSGFHTPDHPPYAAMIHRAIEELNEKGGSSEESISEYIKKQHNDLPLAHSSLLNHHLGKLCDSGEIVVTGKHLYLLPGCNLALESRVRTEKGILTRKRKGRKGRGRVGKKFRTETGKHRETHGEVHGETGRCNKVNDEIIGDNNEMKVHNKVDRVGELDQVGKQTEKEDRMLDEQSQLHQQLSHAICEPVVDSKQPELSSPDGPPGFECINFQSKQTYLVGREEPETIFNAGRLSESETQLQVDQEIWRRGQPNCKNQLLSECSKSGSSDVSTELLPSQNQQQRMDPSNSDGLQGVKSKEVKLLEPHPPKFKQYGRRRKLKSVTKEKEVQDVTAEVDQKTKQLELSDLHKSSPFSAESQQQLEFCKEKQIPESEQQVTSTCYNVDMDTKQQHVVEQHDKSVSNNPIEQQGTKKVVQVVRRSQRLAQSIQTCTLSLDLLPSSPSHYHHLEQPELENDQSSLQIEEVPQMKMEVDYVNLAQKLQQLQLPAVDSVQTTKQTEMESSESALAQVQMVKTTKVLQRRAKLRSWQKSYTYHENTQTACPGSSLALVQTEQVQQEPLCLEYYQQPVALNELSMQQQAHTKLPGKTELEADTSTMDMPPSHQRRPQVHRGRGRGRGRGRPPKMKFGQRSMQNS
ncbi:H15 domain-containing protein [Heracleum sosnowskyi]|uniref:H15 domain-containing protein n=1 Tax=Heracleum sosnowskyi TaxID=360622 RepID=A0AAD8HX83_9APIA|nr:H15 domain-containing protein [Heracleum sosnowskyi]